MPTINLSGATSSTANTSAASSETSNNRLSDYIAKVNEAHDSSLKREESVDSAYIKDREALLAKANKGLARFIERQERQWDNYLRSEAQHEDRQRTADRRQHQRQQTRLEQQRRRAEEREGDFRYRYMRADADHMNRAFDRQRREDEQQRQGGFLNNAMRGYRAFRRFRTGGIRGGVRGLMGAGEGAEGAGLLGGLAEGGALAGMGALRVATAGAGLLAAGIYEGYRFYRDIPSMVANNLDKKIANAQGYVDFINQTSSIANSTGDNAESPYGLRAQLRMVDRPEWRSLTGTGYQDIINSINSYGLRGAKLTDQIGVVRQAALASVSPFMGGQSAGTLAGLFGQYTETSGAGYNRFQPISIEDGANSFFSKLQAVQTKAASVGLDESGAGRALLGLYQQSVQQGAANTSLTGTSALWNAMVNANSPLLRTQQGQQAFSQGLATTAGQLGYNGSMPSVTMAAYEIQKRGGLKAFSSMASLERNFGFKYSDLSPGDKRLASNMLQAAKQGNMYAFQSNLSPFFMSDAGKVTLAGWVGDYSRAFGLPQSVSDVLGANLSNTSLSAWEAWQTRDRSGLGSGSGLITTPDSDASGAISNAILQSRMSNLFGQYPVTSRDLGAIIYAENSGATARSPKGAYGQFQITPTALRDAQQDGVGAGFSMADMADPAKASIVAAHEYQKWLNKAQGDRSLAYAYYNAGNKPQNADPRALARFNQYEASVQNQDPILQGTVIRARNQDLSASQKAAADAIQTAGGAFGSFEEKLAYDASRFDEAASTILAASQNFMTAIPHLLNALSSGKGPNWTRTSTAGLRNPNNRTP